MANEARLITQLSACNAPIGNNLLAVVGNTAGIKNTYSVTVSTLLGNSQANVIVGNTFVISGNTLIIRKEATPANSNVSGHTNNSIWFDNTHIYCVLSNGHIRRVAHESF